jgi:hypothetical protein
VGSLCDRVHWPAAVTGAGDLFVSLGASLESEYFMQFTWYSQCTATCTVQLHTCTDMTDITTVHMHTARTFFTRTGLSQDQRTVVSQ